jgi:hypothetical protein
MTGCSANRIGLLTSQVVIIAISIGVTLFDPSGGFSQTKEGHYSTIDGNTILIHPSRASFQVPLDWTKEYHAVIVTRAQLEKVRNGRGEWYKEYASIVNASLPFSDCIVQAGTHAWNSNTFDGLQLRGYLLDSGVDKTGASIATNALAAANSLPTSKARNASLSRDEQGQWHRILVDYDAWYGDYGGKANVEFYMMMRQAKTIVLVFMYAGPENRSLIQPILNSFSWQ